MEMDMDVDGNEHGHLGHHGHGDGVCLSSSTNTVSYRRMLAMPYGMLLATTSNTKLWEIGNHGLLYYYLDIP